MNKPNVIDLLIGAKKLDYERKRPQCRPNSIFLDSKYARIYYKRTSYNDNSSTLTLRIGDEGLKYLYGTNKNPKTSMSINIFINYEHRALIIAPVSEPNKYFERMLTNNSEISITALLQELDIDTGIYEKEMSNEMVIIYLNNKIDYEEEN